MDKILERVFLIISEFDINFYKQELVEVIRAVGWGWQELRKLDCATVIADPVYSREIRFVVCNWDRLRVLGIFFLVVFALPLLIRILVGILRLIVYFFVFVGKGVTAFLSIIPRREPAEYRKEEDRIRQEEEKRKEVEKDEELTSFGRQEIDLGLGKARDRFTKFQENLKSWGLTRIRWRILRELLFFEKKNENLAGPVWSAFFLFSTLITPLVGLSFLIPMQLSLSAILGFYTIYRILRYRVLLDPNMSYYWSGKRGQALYALAGSLLFLYIIISITAYFLLQLLWFTY